MKFLFVSLNAKYIHSNLAIYNFIAYSQKYKSSIDYLEYTINQYEDDILQDIYKEKPDVIAFSCYIWNIEMIDHIAKELKKVLPNSDIWLGGPEVSYDVEERIENKQYLKGIVIGEGEETVFQLIQHYVDKNIKLNEIKGIAYKDTGGNQVIINEKRDLMELDNITFPYKILFQHNFDKLKDKIIYYESSRGCPYSCSYCLSSIDKKVRFRNIELVKAELEFFLTNKVKQVKFVDRTFNCNKNHTYEIWNYIKNNDNGITNFHFEVSADLLTKEELELLSTCRVGQIQLEIGVQSVNTTTIQAIHRTMNWDRLCEVVRKIHSFSNIHMHLDLIAGLPFENMESFKQSFNEVYKLKPHQLQLGFLKVLKGANMEKESKEYDLVYQSRPPFEVLSTKWLSYDHILNLKSIEQMVEIYYNSAQFENTLEYLLHFHESPFDMYNKLGMFFKEREFHKKKHTRSALYDILLLYFRENINEKDVAIKELLVYDLYLRENLKSRPEFANDNTIYKSKYKEYYSMNQKDTGKTAHIEHFTIDLDVTIKTGVISYRDMFVLFDYTSRNLINYSVVNYEINI